MVNRASNIASFGEIEAKFFGETYGFIDLYRALVTDYRIDKAVLALNQFETVMLNHMTNPDFYGQPSILDSFQDRKSAYEPLIRQYVASMRLGDYVPSVPENTFWDAARWLTEELIKLTGADKDAVFVEKTPHNVFNPSVFDKLFSSPRFVWVIRDPAAIAASLLKMNWAPGDRKAACTWVRIAYDRFFEVNAAVPRKLIKLERLILDKAGEIRALEEFIEMELPDAENLIAADAPSTMLNDPPSYFVEELADTRRRYFDLA